MPSTFFRRATLTLLGMGLALSGASSRADDARLAACADIQAPPELLASESKGALCDYFEDARAIMIVNTASMCGYTGQFSGLQELHQTYGPRGLRLLGFPSDDFGGQEHAKADKTAEVCFKNFGVSFPMFSQVDVRGDTAHPLFRKLASASNSAPRWNFHKYLVTAEGVQGFASSVAPQDAQLRRAIEASLQK
nr:glutathione peroxidase [Oceanococcus sp. HetDA_MAG_MS8]